MGLKQTKLLMLLATVTFPNTQIRNLAIKILIALEFFHVISSKQEIYAMDLPL